LKFSDAALCSAVGTGDTAGVQEQHPGTFLMAGHMGVTMHQYVYVRWWTFRRDMLEAKFQAAAFQIDR
jgi:hypothetical protein